RLVVLVLLGLALETGGVHGQDEADARLDVAVVVLRGREGHGDRRAEELADGVDRARGHDASRDHVALVVIREGETILRGGLVLARPRIDGQWLRVSDDAELAHGSPFPLSSASRESSPAAAPVFHGARPRGAGPAAPAPPAGRG